ncbi:MAG: hypothetical protein ACTSRZ_07850 [Promethearchaeota archaeon]
MSAGKTVRILGGIIVLIGTFGFSWLIDSVITLSGFGIVNLQNFLDLAEISSKPWEIYLAMIFFVLTTISGIMIIIGVKARIFAILFGLIAFLMGLWFILGVSFEIDFIDNFGLIIIIGAADNPVIEGILPYTFEIYDYISLGQVLLLIGGLLSFIGGCIKIED